MFFNAKLLFWNLPCPYHLIYLKPTLSLSSYFFETYLVTIILFWNLPCPYHLIYLKPTLSLSSYFFKPTLSLSSYFFETYPVPIILFLWNLPCPYHLILKPTLSLSSYFETYPVPIILFLCFYLFAWKLFKVYRDLDATTIKVVASDLSRSKYFHLLL